MLDLTSVTFRFGGSVNGCKASVSLTIWPKRKKQPEAKPKEKAPAPKPRRERYRNPRAGGESKTQSRPPWAVTHCTSTQATTKEAIPLRRVKRVTVAVVFEDEDKASREEPGVSVPATLQAALLSFLGFGG